jgi:hypothetical protein
MIRNRLVLLLLLFFAILVKVQPPKAQWETDLSKLGCAKSPSVLVYHFCADATHYKPRVPDLL